MMSKVEPRPVGHEMGIVGRSSNRRGVNKVHRPDPNRSLRAQCRSLNGDGQLVPIGIVEKEGFTKCPSCFDENRTA